ncbi:MAG: hypothetical protein LBB82_11215 [Treponema sp.]|jgi:hypothetical protein|nr:hypothetical protein [Treponema sp.]
MADRRIFALAFVFLLPALITGEEPAESGGTYYIERSGEEERFVQRLVWEKDDYVYRYEITIEKQNSSGEYAEIHREFRTENFIDVSLNPGSYRYRIEVYNLLNRPAGISAWIPFRVFPALQPELYSFSQEFAPAGTADPPVEIVLYGMNLVEGAEVWFLPADGELTPPGFFPAGESARLVFKRLAPGPYRVYVRNPGGLESSLEISVRAPAAPSVPGVAPKLLGVFVSAEYAPLVPLSGYLFDPFDRALSPLGFSLRISAAPLKRSWGDLGLELAPSWNMLNSDDVTIHRESLRLNGLYQRWFLKQTMALIFRAGVGVNFVQGTNDHNFTSIFTWMFSAGGGISFRWFIPAVHNARRAERTLYLEAGVEYSRLFARDAPADYLKPGLGLGARF